MRIIELRREEKRKKGKTTKEKKPMAEALLSEDDKPKVSVVFDFATSTTLGALCLPAMKWYTQAERECCPTGNRSLSTLVKASEKGVIWKILPALSYERS